MRAKPVNLNLFTIKFPVSAIASFLHRVSGVILFLLIPLFLGVLQNTLYYPINYLQVNNILTSGMLSKFFLWVALSALAYHLLAGIRHLIMDLGFLESKVAAKITAYFVIAFGIILSLIAGIKLC